MSKKRINIVTVNGYFNYGNRLQLFALSKILSELGDYDIRAYWPINLKMKIKCLLRLKLNIKPFDVKTKRMKRFTKEYLPPRTFSGKCDYCVVGSDQVWNPDYFKNEQYLLKGNKNSQKISYAASIGKTKLSASEQQFMKEAIKEYKSISVREASAADLLSPLTSQKIETVLDPTLLLNTDEYAKKEHRPDDIEEGKKYILCYVLGGDEYKDSINKLAREKGYDIIYFSDKCKTEYGVEEFLYLIHHAQLICTDSFHACVFSYIFERPFVAFQRTGEANYMYTRLKNLIDTLHLTGREFNGKEITEENLNADYSGSRTALGKRTKEISGVPKKSIRYKRKGMIELK